MLIIILIDNNLIRFEDLDQQKQSRRCENEYQECRKAANDNRWCHFFHFFLVGYKIYNHMLVPAEIEMIEEG